MCGRVLLQHRARLESSLNTVCSAGIMAQGSAHLVPVFVKHIDEECDSAHVRREIISASSKSVRLRDRTLKLLGVVTATSAQCSRAGIRSVVYRKPALCKSLREVLEVKGDAGLEDSEWVRSNIFYRRLCVLRTARQKNK